MSPRSPFPPAIETPAPRGPWRGHALVLGLMVLVGAHGAYLIHHERQTLVQRAELARARVQQAQALVGTVDQVGLQARAALLRASPPASAQEADAAARRVTEALDRAAASERLLGQAAPVTDTAAWQARLDEMARTRVQTVELFQAALAQAREGQAAQALRTLDLRAEVAESRWRHQAEDLVQLAGEQQRRATEAGPLDSRDALVQFAAWGLSALALAIGIAWQSSRRVRRELESRLPRRALRAQPSAARPAVPPAGEAVTPPATDRAAPVRSPLSVQAEARPAAPAAMPQPPAIKPTIAPTPAPTIAPTAASTPLAAPAAAGQTPRTVQTAQTASSRPVADTRPAGLESLFELARAQAADVQAQAGAPAQAAVSTVDIALPTQADEALLLSAARAAERGGEIVSQVVANIEDIGSTGRRIAEIVAVIDSIAFQANLLALNAAVEAARCDASGAALSAAADVRTLARRATQAAREIRALIHQPMSGEGAAPGITQTLQQDTGTTMEALLASVQQAADIIAQVRRAADGDASVNLPEVVQSVEQLDRMHRNHAALVEQSASTAESLRQQAERLQKVLGAFKLLQQTQQAAWGAHAAIRDARDRARGSAIERQGGTSSLPGRGPAQPGDDDPGTGWMPF